MLDQLEIEEVEVCGVREVIRRTGLSPSTIDNYRRDPSKEFPKPFPNTLARVLWSVAEIDQWIATHPLPKRGLFRQEDNAVFSVRRPPPRR